MVPRLVLYTWQIRLGLPKGSEEGSTKVPLQVSWRLWFSEAHPSWATKRFRGRFHHGVSGSLKHIRLRLPKGSAEGSTKVPPGKVPPRFHQSSVASFVESLLLWGRSVLGCQKVPRKVPPRFR